MTKVYPKRPPRQLYLDSILDFGKYINYKVSEIVKMDKNYYNWCLKEGIFVIKGATKPKPICLPEDEGWDEVPLLDLLRWSSGISMRLKPNYVSLTEKFII